MDPTGEPDNAAIALPLNAIGNDLAAMKRKRLLTLLEMACALGFLAAPVWPLTDLCTGRPLGYDCESWFILGLNVFLPFGVLALACSIWSMRTGSSAPHLVFGAGCVAVTTVLAAIALR